MTCRTGAWVHSARKKRQHLRGFRAREPRQGLFSVVFCAQNRQSALRQGQALLAELGRRKLAPESVKAIFLTHAHPDHLGACHLFKQARVYALEGDAKLAAGTARSRGPLPSKMDTPPEKRIQVTDLLKDGDAIQLGPTTITAHHVPGHTAGSAAFLSGGVLMLGDNATLKKDGVVPAPWLMTDDPEENKRSLRALYERLAPTRAVKTLAFSHSGPVDGLDALQAVWR